MGGKTSPSPAPATTDPSAVHFLGPTKPGDCGGSAGWPSAQGPSSHTAQSGRWPGRWPRPGSGGEGWVPMGGQGSCPEAPLLPGRDPVAGGNARVSPSWDVGFASRTSPSTYNSVVLNMPGSPRVVAGCREPTGGRRAPQTPGCQPSPQSLGARSSAQQSTGAASSQGSRGAAHRAVAILGLPPRPVSGHPAHQRGRPVPLPRGSAAQERALKL